MTQPTSHSRAEAEPPNWAATFPSAGHPPQSLFALQQSRSCLSGDVLDGGRGTVVEATTLQVTV